MLLIFSFLVQSATWKDLQNYITYDYEMVTKVFDPQIVPHISQDPKLYQKQDIKEKINDDVPFVGIIECVFDSITDIRDGIVLLKSSSLRVEHTKFTNIRDTYAIILDTCDEIDLNNVEFSNFTDGGAIFMKYCSAIKIYNTLFNGFVNESQTNIDSIILMDTCSYSYFVSCNFNNNNITASLISLSKSSYVTFNECFFSNNIIIYPGCIFSCSCDNICVQNTIFTRNIGRTHSVALLSLNSAIKILHCLFEFNKVEQVKDIPIAVEDLPIQFGSVVITIIQPVYVNHLYFSTELNNVCFFQNGDIPKVNCFFNFQFKAVDIYTDCSKINCEGIIETSGNSDAQVFLKSDVSNIIKNATATSFYILSQEPFYPFIDYGNKPLLPEIRYRKLHIFSSQHVVNIQAPLAYMAIDNCVFEDCVILSSDRADFASLMHINLNHGGAVSIINTIIEDNIVSSSIIDIVNAKKCCISECTFSYNTAKHSSAALISNVEEVRICGNTIEKNNALIHGAIALYNCSNALVIQNVFSKNTGFFGCSSLIVNNSNVNINDTLFFKNNMDFECTNLPDHIYVGEIKNILLEHRNITGVYTPRKIAAAIVALGESTLNLYNVAFSDSENEAEKDVYEDNITIAAIDGYAEDSVKIKTSKVCTDTANGAFAGKWSVSFIDDKCEVGPYLRHIEVYYPIYTNITHYTIGTVGDKYKVTEYKSPGVRYDPINRVDCPSSVDEIVDPDEPVITSPPQAIERSTKTAIIICIGFISFTLVVLIIAAIYFCRQPPDEYIDEDDQRKTGLLDDEDDDDGLGI